MKKNKKILITGGLGYIGMELAKLYSGKSRKEEVIVLDNKYFSKRVSQLKRWNIDFKQIDILDKDSLSEYVSNADIVYHLAGITDVPTTKEDSDKSKDKMIYEVGVIGTRNVINFLSSNSKIVFPSTHVIFEGLKKLEKNIDEERKPKPVLEYAKGKYQSEIDIINSKKNYSILRLGSVYGNSFDSTRFNIMGNLFSKITAENGEISLFSSGHQLKSMVSVFDVARALMFAGENEEINREVINCVNENYTVKEVADICKKVNKKISIKITKNTVPNKGYSLSNDKIKSFGFKFLYSFNKSVKEFFHDLSDNLKLTENEIIDIGKDNYIDDRGIISNYYFEDSINMIGYVESKKNTVRGNHYHPIQTQKCLLISGSYISVTKDLLDENSVVETRVIKSGEMSTIPPYVAHTMVFLEDSVFLNLVNGEREHKNYGITHTIRYELVDNNLSIFLLRNYKTKCRVCNSNKLKPYLSLGLSPLANNLIENKKIEYKNYPLELNYCEECSNSQLSVVVPPSEMFDNYLYLSSAMSSFKKYFNNLANKLKKQLNLDKKSLVVDIGSNDGVFLQPLKDLGIKAIGVEPAKNVAKIANELKLETLQAYFDDKTCKKILQKYGKADLVTAFNVFAHNDNLYEIALNIEKILKPSGRFIFEVQYLYDTINDLTFDNIYHEHVNYWTVKSLLSFFDDLDLMIYKVEKVDTHGGSIRVYSTKNKRTRIQKSVNEFLKNEDLSGLHEFKTYKKFAEKIKNEKIKTIEKVTNLINENNTIIGYGAPAKATTVLNYFGLSNKEIEFTLDDNILKQNKIIPGTNIKILKPDTLNKNKKIDYVIILAWNYFDQIKEKMQPMFPNSKFIKLR